MRPRFSLLLDNTPQSDVIRKERERRLAILVTERVGGELSGNQINIC